MSELNQGTNEATPMKLVMDQLPAVDVPYESPLNHADLDQIAEQGLQGGGVVFRELSLGLLTLRCSPSEEQKQCLESILGLALPTSPLTSITQGQGDERVSVRWMSPDEWTIYLPQGQAFELEKRIFAELDGHYSLVNVSGGYTVFELSGEKVVEVLKKSTPIDFYDSEFPVGKVVSTIFAKTGATICRTEEQTYELLVRRSFADYLWLWLQDASQEYGLTVKV
ncbi:sarcosine oxidase subunit gamma [Marinomonas posidonica]|uniref:Sarcosine oxidase gamma subunit n=1 Tax=Marinomonas posidonica (strain CECT 7376 / NCIMB 14433 / IVIA-Po-181) TaxID=491952 RepID=F6CWJ9_MARPP|nr:sarcosine oxidase subunit gamma family protein [Marinomonas posidonica]AEF54349.1 Sarcosine oxidase gamma subunit [Marinomonas posidonica IVIA-Po-181]